MGRREDAGVEDSIQEQHYYVPRTTRRRNQVKEKELRSVKAPSRRCRASARKSHPEFRLNPVTDFGFGTKLEKGGIVSYVRNSDR
jgi:hypothetical protein